MNRMTKCISVLSLFWSLYNSAWLCWNPWQSIGYPGASDQQHEELFQQPPDRPQHLRQVPDCPHLWLLNGTLNLALTI